MQVLQLRPFEQVNVDADRLSALYAQLGHSGAENVVCRALEELAVRLSQSEQLYRQSEWSDLRKNTRSVIAIADQIGMQALSNVAVQVIDCLDTGDGIATAATVSRLIRVGERSLSAIWDTQDMPC